MNKKTIRDIDVKGKKVIIRVDYNVPLNSKLEITDNTRIVCSLDTLNYLLDKGASLILMSHLGRPKGKVNPDMSLKPAAEELSRLLKKPVKMLNDCIGDSVKEEVSKMNQGDVFILENLRFYKEETDNDSEFAKKLSEIADIYVNDAFGAAHRAHASTEGIAKYLPAVAGLLMEKEIEYLGKALENPTKPFTAIVGGSKVSSKITVLNSLMEKSDNIVIGGAMSYTFFKSMGKNIGTSLVEDDYLEEAKKIMENAKAKNVNFLLPVDNLIIDGDLGAIMKDSSVSYNSKVVDSGDIPDSWQGVDIGPKTIENIKKVIQESKTVIWNGPVGVYEIKEFSKGTEEIAKILAESNVISIIGGGDCVAAVNAAGVADKMSHVSTGGGASLEMMEGKVLPGLAALNDK